ncbi:MAG TPA: carboxypeptidase-like regulatory domain-containing protein [Blastocatellia bacterium]|nr:carboxypeptidase-like regulatory domain-containing protein [Blastocatellia bacterium]
MADSGNLYGTVIDDQGQALPGVTVTLMGLGPLMVQITDARGRCRFPNLSPGTYSLRAQLEGFATVDDRNIQIRVGRNTEVEVEMKPAVTE